MQSTIAMPLPPVTPPPAPSATPRVPVAARPQPAAPIGPRLVEETKPAPRETPSERALEAVQAAARAYEHLRETGRELRFSESSDGILRIEVFDSAGELIRRIPPNEALAHAAGQEMTWLA
jgi:hypothetical protein